MHGACSRIEADDHFCYTPPPRSFLMSHVRVCVAPDRERHSCSEEVF